MEMGGVRKRHTVVTEQTEMDALDQNDILMDREAPHNKFKLFRGRHVAMMSLSTSKFSDSLLRNRCVDRDRSFI